MGLRRRNISRVLARRRGRRRGVGRSFTTSSLARSNSEGRSRQGCPGRGAVP